MTEIKKTLGGERVGAEGKMEVTMHGFNRSTHDIGRVFATDQAAGTIVPCFVDVATNGTDYYIDLDSKIRTLPTNGPIFGTFKHQIDVYKIPIRLYNAMLHNNALGIGLNMSKVYLPKVKYYIGENEYTTKISNDSLTAYLGVRGIGRRPSGETALISRKFPAIFELAYWDIYKNYYANKQEEIGMVIAPNENAMTKITAITITGTNDFLGKTNIDVELNNSNFWTMPSDLYVNIFGEGNANNGKITIETSEEVDKESILNLSLNFVTGANVIDSDYGNKVEDLITYIPKGWNTPQWTLNQISGTQWQIEPIGRTNSATKFYNKQRVLWESDVIQKKDILNIEIFQLSKIDEMRDWILKHDNSTEAIINSDETNPGSLSPYNATTRAITIGGNTSNLGASFSQAGLGIKTYISDRFNNWLSKEWIEGSNGINEISAVKVEEGQITMDALIMQKKIFYMLNRIAISGGSYNDWQEAVWGQKTVNLPESPIYEGGMSSEIVFDEVVQLSSNQNSPLGSLAGRGSGDKLKRGISTIHVHIEEPSILMILESITPRVMYSQGNKWFTALETLDDLHKPNLDGIGFQDLITEEFAADDTIVDATGIPQKFSAGKQPSWIQYQTNVDESYGGFSYGGELEWMVLNRGYSYNNSTGRVEDVTTYIDPRLYNKAFANTKIDSKNFWVQINIKCEARRVMSANQIPNL